MYITKSYNDSMDKIEPIFSRAFRYFLDKNPKITQGKIAEATKIKQAMISGMKSGKRRGTEESRRAIAQYFKVSYDDFLETGKNLLESDMAFETLSSATPSIPDVRTERHYRVVDSFKDKNTALEINEILLKIENQRPDRLVMAKKLISALLDDHESDQQKKSLGTGTGD